MEKCKKPPFIIVAFFSFLIAAFFVAEHMEREKCLVHRLEKASNHAEKHLVSWYEKALHQAKCAKKHTSCFHSKFLDGAKCAKKHAFHLADGLMEKLPF